MRKKRRLVKIKPEHPAANRKGYKELRKDRYICFQVWLSKREHLMLNIAAADKSIPKAELLRRFINTLDAEYGDQADKELEKLRLQAESEKD